MGGEASGRGHERSFCGSGEVLFLDLGTEGYVHFVKMHRTQDLHTFLYVCDYVNKDCLENIAFN